MKVYQVMQHEWNSDANMWEDTPLDGNAYKSLPWTAALVNRLNRVSLERYDATPWHDENTDTFKGDRNDPQAVADWASGRTNCLTHFTLETLSVL